MSKTTLEILTKARALIADPADWCSDGPGYGGYLPWRRQTRCLQIAVRDAAGETHYGPITERLAFDVFKPLMGHICYGNFNDTHTHAEVITLIDRAIAAERAKAQPSISIFTDMLIPHREKV